MPTIGVRQARAELPALVGGIEDGEPVTITRHGKPAAAILPAAAVEVWQRHQEAEAARERREAAEQAQGERLPKKSTPVCPHCRSSYFYVVYTATNVNALVNTADPGSGVQAVTVDSDPGMVERQAFVRCASCWEAMGERARQHGFPAQAAATDIAEEGSWPKAGTWELAEVIDLKHEHAAARIVTAHDLARGTLIRVSRWEYLTGILDSEREQLRAEREARGEDPWNW